MPGKNCPGDPYYGVTYQSSGPVLNCPYGSNSTGSCNSAKSATIAAKTKQTQLKQRAREHAAAMALVDSEVALYQHLDGLIIEALATQQSTRPKDDGGFWSVHTLTTVGKWAGATIAGVAVGAAFVACEGESFGTLTLGCVAAGGSALEAVGCATGTVCAVGGETQVTPGTFDDAANAESVITDAARWGSGMKRDAAHIAPDFVVSDIGATATVTYIKGGDGITRMLVQMPGEMNGNAGRYEWMVESGDQFLVTHQWFVKDGTINGIPNKP
jgi:hypothetical protein